MKNFYLICLFLICLCSFQKTQAQTEVTFWTTKGSFKVFLTDSITHVTVDSFKSLVKKKFYDHLTFHRVVAGFVIQGGDPLGNGTGGPGYTLPDEFTSTLKNITGTIAMAHSSAPHSGGSQFYFNLVDNHSLDNQYTVFGMVTSGLSVVQTIGTVAVDGSDKPLVPVYIDSIRITKYPVSVPPICYSDDISVYPNPNNGLFTVNIPGILTHIQIVNISGQVVYKTESATTVSVDLSKQPKGIYVLRTVNEHGSFDTKLEVR